MRNITMIVIALIVTVTITFGGTSLTADAGTSSFTQMMYRELLNTQKNPREVTRVFEPSGRGAGNEGDTDVRLSEVGQDYFCGRHIAGPNSSANVLECWRDNQVVSVAFFISH